MSGGSAGAADHRTGGSVGGGEDPDLGGGCIGAPGPVLAKAVGWAGVLVM